MESSNRRARFLPSVFLAGLLMVIFGCTYQQRYARNWEKPIYTSIVGQVVDAEDGTPVEGAVAFCLWTRDHGVGLTYTKVYKVEEAVSDREGHFHLSGVWNPFVNPPELTVYKRGYVAWNNMETFPARVERRDFSWKDGFTAKMEKWKDTYSFVEHEGFIARYTEHSEVGQQDFEFFKATEWERLFIIREMDKRNAEQRR